jgi:parallel beta-helix repeat protein
VIFGNEVVGNDVDGISVSGSASNTISDNNVTGNGWSGIGLFGYSSDNNVTSNNVVNNPEGIAVVISARNEISGNTIVSNSNWGISIYQSLNNRIFHNEFNNSLQVNSDGSPNMWDNGYPSGGNYWSDYNGVDVNSGLGQDLPGSDGIGDTPYFSDANNRDRYPLTNPWTLTLPVVTATMDIKPHTLDLRSKSEWVICYIELPEGCNVADINVSTMLLNDTVPAELTPTAIEDYDSDGVPDLMVKFNRTAVSDSILSKGIKYGNVTLLTTGRLYDGIVLKGSKVIRVRMTGDIDCDGKVDVKDVAAAAVAYGSYPGHPKWDPNADENEDDRIDVRDIALISRNFGKSYR